MSVAWGSEATRYPLAPKRNPFRRRHNKISTTAGPSSYRSKGGGGGGVGVGAIGTMMPR